MTSPLHLAASAALSARTAAEHATNKVIAETAAEREANRAAVERHRAAGVARHILGIHAAPIEWRTHPETGEAIGRHPDLPDYRFETAGYDPTVMLIIKRGYAGAATRIRTLADLGAYLADQP